MKDKPIKTNIQFGTKIDLSKMSRAANFCVRFSPDNSMVERIIISTIDNTGKTNKFIWRGVTGSMFDFRGSGARMLDMWFCGKHKNSLRFMLKLPEEAKTLYLAQKYYYIRIKCDIDV